MISHKLYLTFMQSAGVGVQPERSLLYASVFTALYVAAFIAYAAASLLCAISETIWFFVPMRFALGLVGGVIIPLGQGLSLAEFPEHRRGYGAALWGVISMAPFTLGVFMGGFWAEYFNWRMLFYSNIIIGLPIAGIVGALLYGRDTPRRFAGLSRLRRAAIDLRAIMHWRARARTEASSRLASVSSRAGIVKPCPPRPVLGQGVHHGHFIVVQEENSGIVGNGA